MSYKANYTAKARKDLKNLPRMLHRGSFYRSMVIREDPYAHAMKIKRTKRHPLYTYSACEYRVIMDIIEIAC